MSDIFDQLAAGNPAAHQPTQSNQPATPSQPQAQSGDIFDQLASGTYVSHQAPQQPHYILDEGTTVDACK